MIKTHTSLSSTNVRFCSSGFTLDIDIVPLRKSRSGHIVNLKKKRHGVWGKRYSGG